MTYELSEFFIEKAKNELREDETRKKQSFDILNNWLDKHPFIKVIDPNHFTPNIYLPYLRAKKYSMDNVYESLENTLVFIKQHKSWSNYRGEDLHRALDLYDTGYLIASKERDSKGRRIIFCSHKLDTNRFNGDDAMRLFSLMFSTLSTEQETQIVGALIVHDTRMLTMNYLTLFSMKSIYNYAQQIKSSPFRLKKLIFIGLPAIAQQVFKFVKSAMSEKITKRLLIINNPAELKNEVDTSILPLEFGGKFTAADLMDDFRPRLVKHAEDVSLIYDSYNVDFAKLGCTKEIYGSEIFGSFRKLDID